MNSFVLVIGSNSFAGSNFVNFLLSKDYKVIGLSRSQENIKSVPICYAEIYQKYLDMIFKHRRTRAGF